MALVGGVAWVVGQRQHLARDGVEHDYAAGLGLARNHRIAQLLISKKLHLAVNAELDVLAINRQHLLANALDDATQAILDHPPRTRLAGKIFVKSQLNALLPLVFDIGEADDVRNGFAFRVFTLVLFSLVNTGNAQCMDFLGDRLFKLALDPDEGLVLIAELLVQFGYRHFKQPGQLCELGRSRLHIVGYGPDAGGRHT